MLYYNTVDSLLKESLETLMAATILENFRLVGGTSLSLQIGHRMSVDIDLFTDAEYGSVDFEEIDTYLKSTFPYVDSFSDMAPSLGKSYAIGTGRDNAVKLDLYYTDQFIQPAIVADNNIRLATIEEIIAMKVDIVQRGGRKKDFWDLHAVLDYYDITKMLDLHLHRYPYGHDHDLIVKNFTNFKLADGDFEPICLQGKYWDFIKDDIKEAVSKFKKS
ncbi:nucleotidyl transferase AbiEii/AbiGii toxin family protein [Chryseobacterium profundimaris]|uniref:Nucleotidyl transferase AbiEii toxin, Type IV TA system n=1 Tax=Chryseobacterium profundimaris TaxID=1387275 RepID=A0ABY1PHQ9_9FLAO|nr:nucleotidyl transferase AbiEii/AbiGii toxin family protein [Chryseobacterium profundimaris]SMP33703.1 Nucleotidyl transferase AbiEii toxin, Type IV TA system [Chryseobacterium profundimaris]